MKKNISLTFYLLALAVAALAGSFHFFHASAQTELAESSPEQAFLNGRIAFSVVRAGMSTFERSIQTSNADGSGGASISTGSISNPFLMGWSSDGTRIVFSDGDDLYTVNETGGATTNLTNTPGISEGSPSWSVTGKIAYSRTNQIWTMNADGTGQTQFTAITRPSPGGPRWSPNGSRMAFISSGELWVIDANGANQQLVTTNVASSGSWSPDGLKLVFQRNGGGISVVNADGTNLTPITMSTTDRSPSWSPDGTRIAFRGSSGLYTMDPDGSNQFRFRTDTILFPTPCCDITHDTPIWQPVAQSANSVTISGNVRHTTLPMVGVTVDLSGSVNTTTTTDGSGAYSFSNLPLGGDYRVSVSYPKYFFTPANRIYQGLVVNQSANFEVLGICISGKCVKNGKLGYTRGGEIRVMNPDGTGDSNITNNPAVDSEPEFGADGSLLFTSNRDGNTEIYRMSTLDGTAVNLTQNAASDTGPRYSPDGKTIIFVSSRDGNSEIYRMNIDGSGLLRLTNSPDFDAVPAFSADGRKIIFVHPALGPIGFPVQRPHTMNIDGSDPQPLPFPPNPAPAPVYEYFNYSPDGSKIMMTYASDASTQFRTTWTMDANGTNYVRFPADGKHGVYSPDGTRVVYTCCEFNSTNHLKRSDAAGTEGSIVDLTPSTTANGQATWQPIAAPRPTQFDFDGDSRSDVSFFRGDGGYWYVARSSGGTIAPQWGLATDKLVPADFDGDLKTDFAVWRETDFNFYILNSQDFSVRVENFGLTGDIPTGGDFDGDSRADVAVYRPGAQGTFYYRRSMGNPQRNISFVGWGVTGDKPVVGDFDGDSRTDVAVYRPSSGTWYILKSSDGQLIATNFGISTDKPVPADYDADGKTDIAVFRDGVWYLLRSSQGFAAFQFGIANDIPVAADYDGDGSADAAIFRNGDWWILKTSGGVDAIPFGSSGDRPIPAAFVR